MPRANDFILNSVVVSIFTPDVESFSAPSILANVLGRYQARYNGGVQALPLPEDAPPEIPHVVLASKDEEWQFQASPARVNSVWNRRNNRPEALGNMVASCVEVSTHYVESANVRVGRLALVLTRVFDTDNPPQELIDRFCNPDLREAPFNRSQTFEIHNHKRYTLIEESDLTINSWVRCKTAFNKLTNRRCILVEQDINTLSEELGGRRFNAVEIQGFFQRDVVEVNNILSLYFPNKD
jgi:hypothetical protein